MTETTYLVPMDCAVEARRNCLFVVVPRSLCCPSPDSAFADMCRVDVIADAKMHVKAHDPPKGGTTSRISSNHMSATMKYMERDFVFQVIAPEVSKEIRVLSSGRVASLRPSVSHLAKVLRSKDDVNRSGDDLPMCPSEVVIIATAAFRDSVGEDSDSFNRILQSMLRILPSGPSESSSTFLNVCMDESTSTASTRATHWLCRGGSALLNNSLLQRADAYVRRYTKGREEAEKIKTKSIVRSNSRREHPSRSFATAINAALRNAQHRGAHNHRSRPPLHLVLLFAENDATETRDILSIMLEAKARDASFRTFCVAFGHRRCARFARDVLAVSGAGRGILFTQKRKERDVTYHASSSRLYASSRQQQLPICDEWASSTMTLEDALLIVMSDVVAPYVVGASASEGSSTLSDVVLPPLWSGHCGFVQRVVSSRKKMDKSVSWKVKGRIPSTMVGSQTVAFDAVDDETEDVGDAKSLDTLLPALLRIRELEHQKFWPFPPRAVEDLEKEMAVIAKRHDLILCKSSGTRTAMVSSCSKSNSHDGHEPAGLLRCSSHVRPDRMSVVAFETSTTKGAAKKRTIASMEMDLFESGANRTSLSSSSKTNDRVAGSILSAISSLFSSSSDKKKSKSGIGRVAPDLSPSPTPPISTEFASTSVNGNVPLAVLVSPGAIDRRRRSEVIRLALLQRADGSWRWTESFASVVRDALRLSKDRDITALKNGGQRGIRLLTWSTAVGAALMDRSTFSTRIERVLGPNSIEKSSRQLRSMLVMTGDRDDTSGSNIGSGGGAVDGAVISVLEDAKRAIEKAVGR
eukprot:g5308.t1